MESKLLLGIEPTSILKLINKDVINEHIDEAAYLFSKLIIANNHPAYDREEFIDLAIYLDANLKGICLNPNETWLQCKPYILDDDDYFCIAAYLAFQTNNVIWQKQVLTALNRQNAELFILVLCCIDYSRLKKSLINLLEQKRPFLQYIGLMVCLGQRRIPDTNLQPLLESKVPFIKATMLRLIGELKQYELINWLYKDSHNKECQLWAARSSALLGLTDYAITTLYNLCFDSENPQYQVLALQVLIRIVDFDDQQRIINRLYASNYEELAVMAAGMTGQARLIPWLIEMIKYKDLAKLAGESISMITGVNLEEEELVVEDDLDLDEEDEKHYDNGEYSEVEDYEEEEEEEEENSEDEYQNPLPLPDYQLLIDWWQKYQNHYPQDKRLLVGTTINESGLTGVFYNGLQRQRQAAALEYALLNRINPYWNANMTPKTALALKKHHSK